MLAQLLNDTAPEVDRFTDGDIAIFFWEAGQRNGMILSPKAATAVAVKILATVADADGDIVHDVDGFTFHAGPVPGDEHCGLITFRIGGAPVSAELTATQITELAAAFTAAARYVDAPRLPQRGK